MTPPETEAAAIAREALQLAELAVHRSRQVIERARQQPGAQRDPTLREHYRDAGKAWAVIAELRRRLALLPVASKDSHPGSSVEHK